MFSMTNPVTYHKPPDGTNNRVCSQDPHTEENPAERWQSIRLLHFKLHDCLHHDHPNHRYLSARSSNCGDILPHY